MSFFLSEKSLARMKGVHPDLIRVVKLAITYSEVDFTVTEGVRDMERQRVLIARGLSRTMASKHLLQPDGYGHAVDVMAVGDLDLDGIVDQQDRESAWNEELYQSIADAMDRASEELDIKIRWGGLFKSFFDGPHFELVI